jgi:hypothetical protein
MTNKSFKAAQWVVICVKPESITGIEQRRSVGERKRFKYPLVEVFQCNDCNFGKTHVSTGRVERRCRWSFDLMVMDRTRTAWRRNRLASCSFNGVISCEDHAEECCIYMLD